MIWNLLGKEEHVKDMESPQKGENSLRYGLSSERKNKTNIWTLLGKEEQVEDMNPPLTKGEKVDDMDPPWKWGVMMNMSSMMGWQ